MGNLSKAYLLAVLCTFLYVQSVCSGTKVPITFEGTFIGKDMERISRFLSLLVAICTVIYSQCVCSSGTTITSTVCTDNVTCTNAGKNAVCINAKCACNGAFKDSGGASCVAKVVGDPCKASIDCPSNADCNTKKTCSCKSGYTVENELCLFGVGANCTKKIDCVTNADCDVTTKKCTCSSGFSASNGLCAKQSSADSVKKTVNAIAVSFLCAVLLTII